MTVDYYDWSAYHANVRPNQIAIRDLSANKELTYSELDIRSNKLAQWLQKNGLAKGDRVAILAQNCPEFFELEFACAKIGAIELPLNWRLTKPELEYILNDSTPRVLVYDAAFLDIAIELQKDCQIKESLQIDNQDASNQYESALYGSEGNYKRVQTNHDDLIMIMYKIGRAHV